MHQPAAPARVFVPLPCWRSGLVRTALPLHVPFMTTAATRSKTYRARWIWSDGCWIEGGRVTIAGRQIIGVGSESQSGEIDLGDCLILPGLVNAHTHLEFSSLSAPLPFDQTFASWIRNVVQWRRGQTDSSTSEAIKLGLAESANAGVALLGEIATHWWRSRTALEVSELDIASPPVHHPQLVVFWELLGLKPEVIAKQIGAACRHLIVGSPGIPASIRASSGMSEWQPNWTAGLSPHAPYSVSGELFAEAINLARASNCPVAMHLAETHEELELLAQGTGPLADLFSEWGLWMPGQLAAFRTPLEVLQQLAVLNRVLVIHGNYLSLAELDYLTGKPQFSVVYCPRTHSYFQHDRYPLASMLQRGIRVALGTDSRASSPDLNLLSELRHVAQLHPEIAPSTLLEMATLHGAESLGLGDTRGRIAPGRRAEFCILPINAGIRDPYEAILSPETRTIAQQSLPAD